MATNAVAAAQSIPAKKIFMFNPMNRIKARWLQKALRKAVPRMSFHKVGIANVDSSIQVDVGAEVGRVGNLSGARFGLVGIPDVGPAIFVGVATKNLH